MAEPTQIDVFISYASEQREEAAAPLADLLRSLGASVWFDQFELTLGDGLRQKIDEGLAACRFGVVLLSEAFFEKHHTRRELDGLAQREVEGEKVLLPIWFDVDEHSVRRFSPPLADRIAARWSEGLYNVAIRILEVVRPELVEAATSSANAKRLRRIRTGKELAALIRGAHFSYFYNDEPSEPAELDLVSTAAQEVHDWGEIWNDLDPGEHVRTEVRLSQILEELASIGWSAFGERYRGRGKITEFDGDWEWYHFALVRGAPFAVLRVENGIAVIRRPTDKP